VKGSEAHAVMPLKERSQISLGRKEHGQIWVESGRVIQHHPIERERKNCGDRRI
jgi:hypothetical protein